MTTEHTEYTEKEERKMDWVLNYFRVVSVFRGGKVFMILSGNLGGQSRMDESGGVDMEDAQCIMMVFYKAIECGKWRQ